MQVMLLTFHYTHFHIVIATGKSFTKCASVGHVVVPSVKNNQT